MGEAHENAVVEGSSQRIHTGVAIRAAGSVCLMYAKCVSVGRSRCNSVYRVHFLIPWIIVPCFIYLEQSFVPTEHKTEPLGLTKAMESRD